MNRIRVPVYSKRTRHQTFRSEYRNITRFQFSHIHTHTKIRKQNQQLSPLPHISTTNERELTIPQFSPPFTRPSIHPSIPRPRIHPCAKNLGGSGVKGEIIIRSSWPDCSWRTRRWKTKEKEEGEALFPLSLLLFVTAEGGRRVGAEYSWAFDWPGFKIPPARVRSFA